MAASLAFLPHVVMSSCIFIDTVKVISVIIYRSKTPLIVMILAVTAPLEAI